MQVSRILIGVVITSSLTLILCDASWGITRNWDGEGDGTTWGDGLNWDPDGIPGPGDDADVGTATPLVQVSELFMIADLETGATGGVDIQGTLNALGGTVDNNGEIFIDNGPTPGGAALGVGVGTLEGTGEVILGDSDFANTGARLVGPSVGGSATHAAGHTIRGEGTITGNWINEGLILPEDISGDSMGTLRIMGTMTNNGTFRTSATANLLFSVSLTQGPSGEIIADANKVTLNPITITGGVLDSANDGFFEITAGTIVFNDVHNMARVDLINANATTLRIEGSGLVNDGTIVISNDTAATASLTFGSTGELSGSGEVILNREGLGARILSAPSFVATNGANHTLRGSGSIDATLVNEGTIIAEPRGDDTVLEFHDSNSDSTTTNNSVIRADAGGILRLTNVRITQDNTTGRIAANEGTVELGGNHLDDPLVAGGRFETIGAGTVEVTATTRIHDVTNEGQLNIQPGKTLRIGGSSLNNNGTVTFESINGPGFSSATMHIVDNVTLDGDGEFVFTETSGAAFHSIRVDTGVTVTQASEHTIRGEGLINCCGNLGTFINNGRIEGTSATDDIEINGTLGGSGVLKNVQIGGTHSPGESTAIVPIEGAYTLRNFSQLEMEIGGTTPGDDYDQLFSGDPMNAITIGTSQTTLDVSLVDLGNSYVPMAGDRFTIISSPNNIVGEFATINLPGAGLGKSITWAPVDRSDPTKYVLEIAAVSDFFFAADFDEDGDVDGDDLDKWQAGYGTGTAHMDGDADGDNDVDGRDFLIWQRQYGSGIPPAVGMAVPEPSSGAVLFEITMLALCLFQRSRTIFW